MSKSVEAAAVLAWLREAPSRPDHRLISGQECSEQWWAGGSVLREAEEVYALTGKWPGLIGAQYYEKTEDLTTTSANAVMREYWSRGGLVTLMLHMGNPLTDGNVWDRRGTADLTKLTTPGTDQNQRWITELTGIRNGLLEMQEAHVPILFRPFHEMGQDHFWWGARDPAGFKALWRYTHEFLSDLNNLIWVYASNRTISVLDRYPGDEYVDVVGLDAYGNLGTMDKPMEGYRELTTLDKPFALTEWGHAREVNAAAETFNWLVLLDKLKTIYPKCVYFMAWRDNLSIAAPHLTGATEMLADSYVANLGDVMWTDEPVPDPEPEPEPEPPPPEPEPTPVPIEELEQDVLTTWSEAQVAATRHQEALNRWAEALGNE